MTRRWAPPTRYTLRRITARMKDWIWLVFDLRIVRLKCVSKPNWNDPGLHTSHLPRPSLSSSPFLWFVSCHLLHQVLLQQLFCQLHPYIKGQASYKKLFKKRGQQMTQNRRRLLFVRSKLSSVTSAPKSRSKSKCNGRAGQRYTKSPNKRLYKSTMSNLHWGCWTNTQSLRYELDMCKIW